VTDHEFIVIRKKMPSASWDVGEKIFEIFFLVCGHTDLNDRRACGFVQVFGIDSRYKRRIGH
jgi:hypothetical protein